MNNNIFQYVLEECLTRFKYNTAIQYGHLNITYKELNRRADTAAKWILDKQIKNGSFIGILIDNRCDLIISLIGVLKAGCVVVPLYPGYPIERIASMIQTTDLQYIFIDERNFRRFDTADVPFEQEIDFYFMKHIFPTGKDLSEPMEFAGVSYSPEDPLYLHFTSGTAGIPRAIVGKNKSLLHFIKWEIETFKLDSSYHVTQFTIPGIDSFLRDIFAPLLCGGVVCIPADPNVLLYPVPLKNWLERHGIGLIHCVPSLFRLLNKNEFSKDTFKELKCILLAGEKINPTDLVEWFSIFGERIRLVNGYGQTETTMIKTYHFIRKTDLRRQRIPIGKPIRGARIIILDKDMNLCERLVPGEIYIRTPFMSCGYYKNPGLNREKFIQNPYSNNPGDILYRSGDLGKVLLGDNIDILGRVDRQVKVRGYRVELEEIEGELSGCPEIAEAVVIKKETGTPAANEFLCAYITKKEKTQQEPEISITQLKKYLSRKLPDYMLPASIKHKYDTIKPVEKKSYYILSPLQKRLYFTHQFEGGNITYNLPMFFVLHRKINKQRLEQAFKKMIQRHESLRTSFVTVNGEVVQRIHDNDEIDFKVQYIDSTFPAAGSGDAVQDPGFIIQHVFVRPFDLTQAPLMRIGLLEVEEKKHIFMFDMHHLITDWESQKIFRKELMALNEGQQLPQLKLQYKDFSEWENRQLISVDLKKQEEYWEKVFEKEISILDLPYDSPGAVGMSSEGKKINFDIKAKEIKKLRTLAKNEGTTLFVVLLSIYYILLFKLSGQEDILVATTVAGRNHADLENTIGLFVKTMVVRNYPQREKTFIELLKDIKKNTITAFENQDYMQENLLAKSTVKRNENQLFPCSAGFNFLEKEIAEYRRGYSSGMNMKRAG